MQAAAEFAAVAKQVELELARSLGVAIEQVRGIDQLVCPEWVDHLHKDEGDATVDEWDARKLSAGGGVQAAWEARRLRWKSQFVSKHGEHSRSQKFNLHLMAQIRRVHLLLLKKQRELKASNKTAGGTFVFPGLHVNAINSPPPRRSYPGANA